MKKTIILLLCLLLCLTGCQGGDSPDPEESTQEVQNAGVYYPGIDEREIGQNYNPQFFYVHRLLYYNGRVYVSAGHYSSTDKSALVLNNILGDGLGTVSGNHNMFWSSESGMLAETTGEGMLYRIRGYDESFCLGIYYETSMPLADTYYCLTVYVQLNDITLEKGRELFGERLHLEEASRIVGKTPEEGLPCGLPPEEETVKDFLSALNEGVFLDPAEEDYPELDPAEAYTLSFYDTVGLVWEIRVYESGYVTMERMTNELFVLRVDGDMCGAVIGRIREAH